MPGANGLLQWLNAIPHQAIPQDGSAFNADSNPSIARRNSNECSSATARLKGVCAAASQEFAKATDPSFSSDASACWCSCAGVCGVRSATQRMIQPGFMNPNIIRAIRMKRMIPTVALLLAVAVIAVVRAQSRKPSAPRKAFTVVETTISEMRTAMEQGRATSRQIVQQYLTRIATYEDRLHAAITVNPKALEIADERDRERTQGKIRGPLHGIPIALKDNVHTTDLRTTGGALAFENLVPPYEATLTKNLRDAGAIIIAKTGMTELANWVAGAPTPMPGNYNAVGGQGYNPYDPRKDPREATFDGRPALGTGGSSSGVGTAANFWAGNVGTETSGSVLSPSNQNMLAGIKPTVGRISRYGVIPITADQDTAGPMAKTVSDVAIMFGAMESAAPDPNDPATRTCTPPAGRDYTPFLKRDGLKGARIGIPRAFFYDELPGTGSNRGGLNADQKKAMEDAIAVLKQQGAI